MDAMVSRGNKYETECQKAVAYIEYLGGWSYAWL